jgi:hypothetical protein
MQQEQWHADQAQPLPKTEAYHTLHTHHRATHIKHLHSNDILKAIMSE